MKNLKWPVIVLAFIVTLSASAGLVHLRQRQMINEPLFKRVKEYEPVEEVQLRKDGSIQVVEISLGYVDNIALAHRTINDEVGRLLGAGRYKLVIQDKRNEALEAAFNAVHLALFESEQRGNFTEMRALVSETLLGLNVDDFQIMVDQENIYLQIRHGDSYLYEIVARTTRGKAGEQA
jgi:hypothetical protein